LCRIAASKIHVKKRDQAYLTRRRRKEFLKRRHRTIIPYNDSDEYCNRLSIKNETLGVESSNVYCNEDSSIDQNTKKKSHGEATLRMHIEKRDQAYLTARRRKNLWKENVRLS
jgi:hypothetical protein